MLPLTGREQIYLAPSRRQRPSILAFDTKQKKLGDIPEVEADAPAIRTAVLPNLVPDDVRFVLEAPGRKNEQALFQKGIRDPQVQVTWRRGDLSNW